MEAFADPSFWLLALGLAISALASMVLHELGHLAAGALFGVPMRELSLSRGRPIIDIDIGTLRVTLRWPLSMGGRVWTYGIALNRPRDLVALSAGGPLANLIAGGVCWTLSRGYSDDELTGYFLWAVAIQNLAACASNLWPRRRRLKSGEELVSDGARLIERVKGGKDQIARLRAQIEAALRLHVAPDAAPPRLTMATMRAVSVSMEARAIEPKAAARQMQLWRREYARDHDEVERRFMKYTFLQRMIVRAAPSDFEAIDTFSRELVAADPDRPIYSLARLEAIVARGGDDAPTLNVLRDIAEARNPDPLLGVVAALLLAKARAARGETDTARASLQRATQAAARIAHYERGDFWQEIVRLQDRLGAPRAA